MVPAAVTAAAAAATAAAAGGAAAAATSAAVAAATAPAAAAPDAVPSLPLVAGAALLPPPLPFRFFTRRWRGSPTLLAPRPTRPKLAAEVRTWVTAPCGAVMAHHIYHPRRGGGGSGIPTGGVDRRSRGRGGVAAVPPPVLPPGRPPRLSRRGRPSRQGMLLPGGGCLW
ncbi:hypothetical protein I4F81_009358 [Pyropia yezoensis]|uniref:Uncharacterized protein n=1 Tax=Pyropia yezoensis TaxID=2788 RepID=A0ACC3CA43_PYRYE|nr:hypothetical protein I4F81_009358 [Neopyropia yezoensis]